MNKVDIYTSKTCNPCKMLKAYLAKENFKDGDIVYKDIGDFSDDMVKFDIIKVPTIVLFTEEGTKKFSGELPVLLKAIKNYLKEK